MEKRTSFLSLLMSVLLVGLALFSSSCTPTAAPPPETEVVVTKTPVTTIVPTKEPEAPVQFIGQTSSDAHDELLVYLLDQCGVIYTLVEPADYWTALELRLDAGVLSFDIIQMDTTHLPAYAERGYLSPVDDPARPALEGFFEPLVRAFTYEGEPYGVPRDSDALVLLFNPYRFDEVGLDYPHDDWTWGELQEYAKILTEATGMAGFSVPADPYYFRPFVLQAGGDIMSPDFSETWIDHQEAIEAGHLYTGAREEGWAITPGDSGASWYGEALAWGDVAMVLGGYWMQDYLSEQFPDLAYGAVHAPAGPYGKGTVAFPTGYAVPASSHAPGAAWEAIDCLTSVDAQALMLDSGVALPSRRGFQDHPYITDNPIPRAVYTSLEFASAHEWGPHHDELDGEIRAALTRVYYEGWSVEDSFAVAAKWIRGIIAK